MKLYHATKAENMESILSDGICPSNCRDMSYVCDVPTLQGTNLIGVYGWTDPEDAKWFVRENCWRYDAVIVSFETDQAVDDPEFADADWIVGQSKFVLTDTPIKSELVCEY